jgi:hypothetical protein
MPDQTRRYYADTSLSYALAAIALFEYARTHRGEFVFGPMDVEAMKQAGLTISGPDLAGPAEVLSGVLGLVEQATGQEAETGPISRV